MSRRSGAVALTATITVTIFVAAMTFVLNPKDDSDDYASIVLQEAKNRQSIPVTVVVKPLETDIEVLREEDIMAGKVSTILKEDESFMGYLGDKSAEYVGEKISDLEDIYASDTNKRIADGDEASRAYADGLFASSKAYTDEKEKSLKTYSESLASDSNAYADTVLENAHSYTDSSASALSQEISSLKAEISSLKSELESVKEASFTKDEAVAALLSDEVFMSTLADEVSNRVGVEIDTEELTSMILSSASFNTGLKDAMNDYYTALEAEKKAANSIPIPVFDTVTSEEYSEEEYMEARNEQRGDEINRILSFLGY